MHKHGDCPNILPIRSKEWGLDLCLSPKIGTATRTKHSTAEYSGRIPLKDRMSTTHLLASPMCLRRFEKDQPQIHHGIQET